MARMAAFWTLAILLVYGCMSLHTQLGISLGETATKPLIGIDTIPILGLVPNLALIISLSVFFGGLWLLNRWLNKPKNADLLIETEHELRKVTWPTLEETVNGSMLVVGCVVFLMAFLAGTDYLLARILRFVLNEL